MSSNRLRNSVEGIEQSESMEPEAAAVERLAFAQALLDALEDSHGELEVSGQAKRTLTAESLNVLQPKRAHIMSAFDNVIRKQLIENQRLAKLQADNTCASPEPVLSQMGMFGRRRIHFVTSENRDAMRIDSNATSTANPKK